MAASTSSETIPRLPVASRVSAGRRGAESADLPEAAGVERLKLVADGGQQRLLLADAPAPVHDGDELLNRNLWRRGRGLLLLLLRRRWRRRRGRGGSDWERFGREADAVAAIAAPHELLLQRRVDQIVEQPAPTEA
jgi:hypothetical protein